ncbi:uncharacterized protein MONBRDRAFT_32471 [Monosiga brevicollis MX1]|uniref:Nicotinate phosphoribosyltransferase n=1 Tax=Monosiga brevicollis TaxID=81824 RepID=A9UZQ0_MONBE|nr:uncharacterized protein MONBRDRAFT_32471 [Monosiga brevicollis MX1]EDQ89406.1 predicted protein [Monosiga brevicollis MX1]|eukprot:XP_001745982.1 hypothetical protein [Monosiga brevicollis MX1]
MSEASRLHLRPSQSGLQNDLIKPLLTDYYQITMAYAYWQSGRKDCNAVFDLFFRKCPFHGEFTIFAGLQDCINFVDKFAFSEEDIDYLREVMGPSVDPAFFDYLLSVTANDVVIHAIPEGTVVFPRVPLMRVEGPLPIVQLLETTFLNLINYASLVATNAARFRLAAGPKARLLEFGLRRAQGPDGGLSASRYCYIGGFNATSNVLAGKLFGVPISGTHAHAFVSAYETMDQLANRAVKYKDSDEVCPDFVALAQEKRALLASKWRESPMQCDFNPNDRELIAFCAYAIAFPHAFLALIDTYDALRSGCPNFLVVALTLRELGYAAIGVRLDSGDLAYQSNVCRSVFKWLAEELDVPSLAEFTIVASNDINEDTLYSLEGQGHSIDAFGVGTHLVTCQAQPALGCVYKLVEVDNRPCIKVQSAWRLTVHPVYQQLSAEVQKVTMPGDKYCYRLYGRDGAPICDLLTRREDETPKVGEQILCRHPFQEQKRAVVRPNRVEQLYKVYWNKGEVTAELPDIHDIKKRVDDQMRLLRMDHKRMLNPTPYKVSVTDKLYTFIHQLWLDCAPVGELS